MKPYARIFAVFFASLLFAACSAGRTGVVGGVLTTNQRPAISIAVKAPFTLADCGRVWASPRTMEVPGSVTASFDYAVYTDGTVSPAAKIAYAAIIRLEDAERWNFVPQGNTLPGSFGVRQGAGPVDRAGALYTLHVPAAGDWASELLAANGTAVPHAWIAKRWLFSLDKGTRAMAEYREPWPADLDVPQTDLMLLSASNAEFLKAFETRALAVFSFDTAVGDFSGPAPTSGWHASPVPPDVKNLSGDVISTENASSGSFN